MIVIDGEVAIEATIESVRTGAWTIDAKLASETELSGQVTINVDDKLTLLGTVVQAGQWQDVEHVRIVGGAGGLSNAARPAFYSAASLGVILGDLLRQAGETLSPTSDTTTLLRRVTMWTTTASPTGTMIARLLEVAAPGVTWRVLFDGTVWVGPEAWKDSDLVEEVDYVVIARDPVKATATVGSETPNVWAGMSFEGQKVARVQHLLGSPATRSILSFELAAAPAGADRLRRAMTAMVRDLRPPGYLASCWATIVRQSGDTIDVQPVDVGLPSMARVPLLAGLAQWKLQLRPGGHVLVGWGNGDPRQPFVIGFGADVVADLVAVESQEAMTLAAPQLALSSSSVTIGTAALAMPALLSTPYLDAETAFLSVMATFLGAVLESIGSPSGAAAVATALATFTASKPGYLSMQVRHS